MDENVSGFEKIVAIGERKARRKPGGDGGRSSACPGGNLPDGAALIRPAFPLKSTYCQRCRPVQAKRRRARATGNNAGWRCAYPAYVSSEIKVLPKM